MKKRVKLLCFMTIVLLCGGMLFATGQKEKEPVHLKLATTTSTENSGLLAELLPVFEKEHNIVVDVIAVGTGKAIQLGENGDVDVILVHARAAEDKFVQEGYGVNRKDLMHNDFVILGPPEDPAGIKGMASASEALQKISSSQTHFISRGDDSGTHKKEKALWEQAGISPAGVWYKEVGQGMGAVITMSNDMGAYTLADRGTYLAMKSKIDLVVLVEADPGLFNPYGVIAVNPDKHSHVKYNEAILFINFLISQQGQDIIRNFKKEGQVLFYPDVIK
jgi:tungstate transport system substrate-binding protein